MGGIQGAGHTRVLHATHGEPRSTTLPAGDGGGGGEMGFQGWGVGLRGFFRGWGWGVQGKDRGSYGQVGGGMVGF